jgi:hypothetical protein
LSTLFLVLFKNILSSRQGWHASGGSIPPACFYPDREIKRMWRYVYMRKEFIKNILSSRRQFWRI